MFESLKTLWKKEQNPLQDYDQQSRQLATGRRITAPAR